MSTEIKQEDYDIRIANVDELIPYENNPRNITQEAVELVKKSIQENKFSSVIVADKDLQIIAGHTRLQAAKELGIKSVPVFVAKTLDENSVKRLRLLDNKLTENTDWSIEKLKSELDDVDMDQDLKNLWSDLMNSDLSEFDLPDENMIEPEDDTYGQPVIQYVLIFDNETQQQDWNMYLIYLKEKYPELETHSARINADIAEKRGY